MAVYALYVPLYTSEWIEIIAPSKPILDALVSLYTSEWIEISVGGNYNMTANGLTLYE